MAAASKIRCEMTFADNGRHGGVVVSVKVSVVGKKVLVLKNGDR